MNADQAPISDQQQHGLVESYQPKDYETCLDPGQGGAFDFAAVKAELEGEASNGSKPLIAITASCSASRERPQARAETPLDDIRNTDNVRYVMKNGELFDGDDLDMIWPEEKPLPPFLFRDFGPPTRNRAPSLRGK